MSVSIREYVQVNVESAIAGVTTANGYTNTVRHHERARVAPYDGPFPAVFIYDGGDTLQEEQSWCLAWIMTQELHCWLKSATAAANLAGEVNAFLADITKAVMADRTRGGYAIETKVRAVSPVTVTGDNMGGFVVSVEIEYRTKPGDPYTIL